jgi:hypothetical protein
MLKHRGIQAFAAKFKPYNLTQNLLDAEKDKGKRSFSKHRVFEYGRLAHVGSNLRIRIWVCRVL